MTDPSFCSNRRFKPGARVVWEGEAMGVRSRVVVEDGLAIPQRHSSHTWGYADSVLGASALAEAVVALAAVGSPTGRVEGSEDGDHKA